MRTIASATLVFAALLSAAKTAPLAEAELKNLLAGVRQNRSTQADFQEERVIRLMKKPVVSSGRISFQPPNKFRREVKGNAPSTTVSGGRDQFRVKSGEHRKHVPDQCGKDGKRIRAYTFAAHAFDETRISKARSANQRQPACRTHRYAAAERRSNRDDVFKPHARASSCFHFRF